MQGAILQGDAGTRGREGRTKPAQLQSVIERKVRAAVSAQGYQGKALVSFSRCAVDVRVDTFKPPFILKILEESLFYLILADLIVLIHFGFIAFVVFGGLLAFRWRSIPWLHVPAALWGALVEFAGWICPLTPLENYFRRASGGSAYAGDFVSQYLVPLIYPAALTRELQIELGLLVSLINAIVYLAVWLRLRKITH